ncbi:serine protease 30-like [Gracilinanus agilis]|uniref:serine protease 30-like n=1 Tax=Gracilinanus agilis TaxID=191870 RepID=UPI001CFF380E|nr:serine protease 30-like [Gracilinanus agilis]
MSPFYNEERRQKGVKWLVKNHKDSKCLRLDLNLDLPDCRPGTLHIAFPGCPSVFQRSVEIWDPDLLTDYSSSLRFEFPEVPVPSSYLLKLGELQLYTNPHNSFYTTVKRIFIHPSFHWRSFKADVALLQLDSPVQITPVCLPAPQIHFPSGTLCWMTGWGKTTNGPASVLQEVQLPLIDAKACDILYHTYKRTDSRRSKIQDDMICAGYKWGKKDACRGDSGGPLVCKNNNTWFQVGAGSWGIGCGLRNRPGVYVRVQAYTDWIQTTITNFAPVIISGPALLLTMVLLIIQ